MGTAFLMSVTIDCYTLLVTCLPKGFDDGSATFTTRDFECMVRLKKFTLQKISEIDRPMELKFCIFNIL